MPSERGVGSRRGALVLSVVGGLVVVLAVIYALSQRADPPDRGSEAGADPGRHSAPTVPQVDDLSRLDPAVAAAFRTAVAAVEEAPASGSAWGALGVVYQAHRYFALAERCFAEASTLDPATPDWPHLLGVLAEERGDVEAAAVRYRSVLRLMPTNAAARYRLGNVLLEAGRLDEASLAFEELASSNPAEPWGSLGSGRVAQRRGDAAAAAGHFEHALEIDPGNPQAAYLLAGAYREMGRRQEAWRLAGGARDGLAPTWPPDPILDRVRFGVRSLQSMVNAANARLAAGDVGTAEALYLAVLGFDPKHYDALYDLALLRARGGRFSEAGALVRRALEERPESAQARLLLALALASENRLAEARAELVALLGRDPDNAEARDMLDQIDR